VNRVARRKIPTPISARRQAKTKQSSALKERQFLSLVQKLASIKVKLQPIRLDPLVKTVDRLRFGNPQEAKAARRLLERLAEQQVTPDEYRRLRMQYGIPVFANQNPAYLRYLKQKPTK
jgi:hypothetical protein